MMRNDYRRSLILLRSRVPGISGHVRLERRTLMGSMYFVLQVPGTGIALQAALVGRNRDNYYACDLGSLKLDGRGQATLGYNFDPRNICERELEQYQLIVVVRTDGECEIILTGNVSGYADVNWERVRAAVCSLYVPEVSPPRPFPVIPVPPQEPSRPQPDYQGPPPRPYPTEPALPEEPSRPQPDYQGPPPRPFPTEPALPETPENQGQPPSQPEPPQSPGDIMPERPFPQPRMQSQEAEIPAEAYLRQNAVAAGSFAQAQPAQAQTAAELLNADRNLSWPEEVQALKTLFEQQAPMQDAPQDGFVYVKAPLPAGSGYPYCAAGIRMKNGSPASVRYALPSAWTDHPPAGMEEAMWLGDNNAGWWITELTIRT